MAKSTKAEKQVAPVEVDADTLNAVLDKADRLYDAARPEAVFAAPVSAEGQTVIGAAEVVTWAMFGGGGASAPAAEGEPESEAAGGSGAGFGGMAHARPVALVILSRDGVRVEPVVDATKLGLAALTVFGSLVFMLGRMLRVAGRMR